MIKTAQLELDFDPEVIKKTLIDYRFRKEIIEKGRGRPLNNLEQCGLDILLVINKLLEEEDAQAL